MSNLNWMKTEQTGDADWWVWVFMVPVIAFVIFAFIMMVLS